MSKILLDDTRFKTEIAIIKWDFQTFQLFSLSPTPFHQPTMNPLLHHLNYAETLAASQTHRQTTKNVVFWREKLCRSMIRSAEVPIFSCVG